MHTEETRGNIARYPGLSPFQAEQKELFFGRQKEIDALYQLLGREQVLVLYSKSGLGKSSLLNAGLLPRINKERSNLQILELRLGAYEPGKEGQCLQVLVHALEQSQLPKDTSSLDKVYPQSQSLWYQFKARQWANPKQGFLLVFDQFEELFSYPEEEILRFKKQMHELLYRLQPLQVHKALLQKQSEKPQSLSEEEILLFSQPQNIQVLFAIREDKYSLLNSLSDYLPNILYRSYALRPLSREQAKEAIVAPAAAKGAQYKSPRFAYSPEALEHILDYLTQGGTRAPETTQLQILCNSIEQLEKTHIELEDIPDLQDVFQNYYQNTLQKIEATKRQLVQNFIETKLIQKEQRIAFDKLLLPDFIDEEVLRILLDEQHLLRAERTSTGGISYELAHDSLIAPISQLYAERRSREELLAQQEAAKQAQKEAREVQKKLAKKQKQLLLSFALLAFAFAALVFALVAGYKAQKAKNALLLSQEQLLEEKELSDSALRVVLLNSVQLLDERGRNYALAYDYAPCYIDSLGYLLFDGRHFEEAQPFDRQRGLAEVLQDGKSYLLDMEGKTYRLAKKLSELDDETEALDLSKQGLELLAPELFRYTKLKFLFLDENALSEIPPGLEQLQELRVLSLRQNQVQQLDAKSFTKLEKLEVLDLSINPIDSLPPRLFAALQNLQILQLAHSKLQYLDERLFEKLQKLRILNLGNAEFLFGSLPYQSSGFLYLSPELLASCPQLEELDIQANSLESFPKQWMDYPKLLWGKNPLKEEFLKSLLADSPALEEIRADMIALEAGIFLMGCKSEALEDCLPDNRLQELELDAFAISRYELRQKHWLALMGTSPFSRQDCLNCPADNISWLDASQLVSRLQWLTGLAYDLPTEAQWEYAAQAAGRDAQFLYAGSSTLADIAWYAQNSQGFLRPVGQKQPNSLGLYDLNGNVAEWCSDWYSPSAYEEAYRKNPQGPDFGQSKVLRGGSVLSNKWDCRHWQRSQELPDLLMSPYMGIRLVLNASSSAKG